MVTAIEDDARRNFNRRGLPAGYDPIAPTHILGYASPPIRIRPAGSLADPSTYGPLIAYAVAFAALSHYALKGMSPEAVRANPSVEPGTRMMHLQQHVAALLDRAGTSSPSTRYAQRSGFLKVTNVPLTYGAKRALEQDAARYGYTVSYRWERGVRATHDDHFDTWSLTITHPIVRPPIENVSDTRENPTTFTTKQATRAGKTLHTNFERLKITPFLLRVGMNTERDHSNVTHGSPTVTAKLALAHLKETPDYYSRLKRAGL